MIDNFPCINLFEAGSKLNIPTSMMSTYITIAKNARFFAQCLDLADNADFQNITSEYISKIKKLLNNSTQNDTPSWERGIIDNYIMTTLVKEYKSLSIQRLKLATEGLFFTCFALVLLDKIIITANKDMNLQESLRLYSVLSKVLYDIGRRRPISYKTPARVNGGKSNLSHSIQRKKAEEIFRQFQNEHPDLYKEYKNNPNHNKPKTVLKLMLQNDDDIGSKTSERTLSNWAKTLLENNGNFEKKA